jgi:ATP-dependent Lhr-like helicase
MSGVFERLAPFIQEYVYAHGWTELKSIQGRAIAVILDTESHMLLSAGTASGKTEAAFFPILTQLCREKPKSVQVLYVGPLKALIND